MFPNASVKTPKHCRLADVLRDIRGGQYAKPVASIRETFRRVLDQTGDTKQAKGAIAAPKKKLPAFCMSGTAKSRTEPLTHSGLLQIDLDGLGGKLETIRDKVRQDIHVAFGFLSPSGDGLKLGLRIDGERHAESFTAAQAHFMDRYELEIDSRCKDRLRLCFVSHDPDLWINPGAVPLPPQERVATDIRLNPASCVPTSLHDCIPASLHNKADAVLANITANKAAQKALATKHPNLVRLYTRFIEPRFEAIAGQRNDFVVRSVPFLYRAVAPQFVLELVGCFYDCHRALFNDPREQHMKEVKAMLESVTISYAKSLADGEGQIYSALDAREQNAFRICRDLALLPEPKREPLTFYLSFDHLADRLGIFPMQAQRTMRQLESYGLVKLLKKGTRRAAGVPGEAGTYQWLIAP